MNLLKIPSFNYVIGCREIGTGGEYFYHEPSGIWSETIFTVFDYSGYAHDMAKVASPEPPSECGNFTKPAMKAVVVSIAPIELGNGKITNGYWLHREPECDKNGESE